MAEPRRSRKRSVCELSGRDLHPCSSEQSLNSNASLPSMPCGPGYEGRAASWAVCFERLLHDALGLQLFTAFLKKEFSEENIMFWQACEDFRQIQPDQAAQLFQTARQIYDRFLSEKAAMPVNIDSQAHISDANLNAPHPAMFQLQQQQIFNLMKFDSYSRFLKSPSYQECLLAEVEGRPLSSAQADGGHAAGTDKPGGAASAVATPKKATKKAKSTKAAGEDDEEERVRRKVGGAVGGGGGGGHGGGFPWIISGKSSSARTGRRGGDEHDSTGDSNADMARSNSVGSLTTSKSEFQPPPSLAASSEGQMGPVAPGDTVVQEKGRVGPLCRVLLPDGSSAVISVSSALSVRDALRPLCDKRGLALVALDVFLVNGDRQLVLEQESLTLSNREIRLERRILFRLDLLPITKSVGVKAKPNKPVEDVLHSVVQKYGLKLKDMVASMHGNTEALDMSVAVSQLDGKHVVLEAANNSKEKTIDGKFKLREVNSAPASSGHGSTTSGHLPTEQDAAKARKSPQPKPKESDEWLELLSRAQRRRADDQRGLLRKEDLVLPDFLRVTMGSEPSSSSAGRGASQGAPSGGLPSDELPTPQSQASRADSQAGGQQQDPSRAPGQQPLASELSPNAHQPVSQSSSCPHLEMKQAGGPKLHGNVLQISIMFESRAVHAPAGAQEQAEKAEDSRAAAKQASHGHENKTLARLQDGSKAIGKASSEEVIVEFSHPPDCHASPSAPGHVSADKEFVNFVCTVTAPAEATQNADAATLNENRNNSSDVRKANGQRAAESRRATEPSAEEEEGEGGECAPEKAPASPLADSDKSAGTEGSSLAAGVGSIAESAENGKAAPV